VIAFPRRSDIVILRFINPMTYCDVEFNSLSAPVQVTLAIGASVNTTAYNYRVGQPVCSKEPLVKFGLNVYFNIFQNKNISKIVNTRLKVLKDRGNYFATKM